MNEETITVSISDVEFVMGMLENGEAGDAYDTLRGWVN